VEVLEETVKEFQGEKLAVELAKKEHECMLWRNSSLKKNVVVKELEVRAGVWKYELERAGKAKRRVKVLEDKLEESERALFVEEDEARFWRSRALEKDRVIKESETKAVAIEEEPERAGDRERGLKEELDIAERRARGLEEELTKAKEREKELEGLYI
jgi:hypothetical protein